MYINIKHFYLLCIITNDKNSRYKMDSKIFNPNSISLYLDVDLDHTSCSRQS